MDMKLANGQPIYPDANSTLRLTYGQVLPYAPADGVKYDYYTTLKGAMEKEDPDNWEFVVPAKLKQLYQAKGFRTLCHAERRNAHLLHCQHRQYR